MTTKSTLSKIAVGLSSALSSLQDMTSSFDEFANFLLTELGLDVSDIPQPVKDLASDIDRLVNLTQGIADETEIDYGTLAELLAAIVKLVKGIEAIADGAVNDAVLTALGKELLDYLVIEYLSLFHPFVHAALRLPGIVALEQKSQQGDKLAYMAHVVNWSRLSTLLTKPSLIAEEVYHWGSTETEGENAFDFLQLAYNLSELFGSLGFSTFLEELDAPSASALEQTDPQPGQIRNYLRTCFAIDDDSTIAESESGIGFFPLPKNTDHGLNPGFAIMPYGVAKGSLTQEPRNDLSFIFETGLDIKGGVGLIVRPGMPLTLLTGFRGPSKASDAKGSLRIGLLYNEGARLRLLTVTKGIFVDVQSAGISGGVDLVTSGKTDLFVELELKGGRLVIGTDGADTFLTTVLPKDGITSDFDLAVGLSSLRGLHFRGSGGLEIQLPSHAQLGPVELQGITISVLLKEKDNKFAIPISAGASVKAALGPLTVVIEDIGLQVILSQLGTGGNLGLLDLQLGFKPPKGIALSINAGAVKGGGYLYLDYEKGEYAGAFELTLAGWIGVQAYGLINTHMPDGASGFSLLIGISADFGALGIQLGYGFVLNSVGGLLGLNRTMNAEPLTQAIRTGSLNNILFPKDLVANAPRIISDLRTIFPPQPDRFLIGPMLKLSWGTPALVSVSLGIILEIPPGNITILGVLKVALPTDKAPLILLQVAFIGRLEFDKSRLWFFAGLFDSHVVNITIDGEMGIFLSWGKDANFLISVGGFHPSFTPPPLPFPTPKRVSVSIAWSPVSRMRLTGYFAVTTNTVQFGARAELYFGFSECNLSGYMAFDVLFQFSPFYFTIKISCEVSLSVFGCGLFSVRLHLSLEGPTPWRAKGSFSITIFWFIDISIGFDFTWGSRRDTSLPPIEVMPLLHDELDKMVNWTASLPNNAKLSVTLRELDEAPGTVVLHPVGTLRISQRAVPLNVSIDRVGNRRVKDFSRLGVMVVNTDNSETEPNKKKIGFEKVADTTEYFAMAQYQRMDDAAKLSRRAYEPQHGGLILSPLKEGLSTSHATKRVIRYELVTIDTNYRRKQAHTLSDFPATLFSHFLAGSAVTKSTLSRAYGKQLQPIDQKITIKPDCFAVVDMSTNRPLDPKASAEFGSEALAYAYLDDRVRENPSLAEQLQVIPRAEVNTA